MTPPVSAAARRAGTAPAPTAVTSSKRAVREATPLALAGFVANAANVLVTLIVARQLTTRGYGTQAQLVAIFFVVSMPGSALLVGIVRRATNWQARGLGHLIPAWARRIRRVGLVVILGVAVLGTALSPVLTRQLSVPTKTGLVAVLTAGAAWGMLCIDRGLLQARHAYGGLAANLLIEAGLRCGLTVGLVLVGLGAPGVAFALLLGVLGADGHAQWQLSRRLREPASAELGPVVPPALAMPPERRLITDVGIALTALGLLGLLQNLDVVILGRARPEEAGAYAAISVASKALVFAALVLSSFLLPEAASQRHVGQHALRQLGGTLSILAVPCLLLVGVAAVAPEFLIRVAFGPRYISAANALLPLALAMTCLGATVLFTHYLLGAGHRRAVVALFLGTAVAAPLLVVADGRPRETAVVDLAVQAGLAAVTGAVVLIAALRPVKQSRRSSG